LSSVYVPSESSWWLFGLCSLAWVGFEMWTSVRTWPAGSLNRDHLSRYVIAGVVSLSFAVALGATRLHAFDLGFARPQVFYLGLALIVAGLVFRAYAVRQLGRYFTPEVIIQPGQHVVDRGLYRFLRHPSYTGIFITLLGYGLALTNALSLALMLVLPGLAFGYRMRVEEAALSEALGEEYVEYMRRTKRLIPFIY
jgi:protein-S-isoprenylcysteine O-methyltransferase Ste14